jgi:hypothetical protein
LFWCVAAAIYLLLRYDVDHTEMDEVFLPEQEFGDALPDLPKDEAGVPGAPEEAPVDPPNPETGPGAPESADPGAPESADAPN